MSSALFVVSYGDFDTYVTVWSKDIIMIVKLDRLMIRKNGQKYPNLLPVKDMAKLERLLIRKNVQKYPNLLPVKDMANLDR